MFSQATLDLLLTLSELLHAARRVPGVPAQAPPGRGKPAGVITSDETFDILGPRAASTTPDTKPAGVLTSDETFDILGTPESHLEKGKPAGVVTSGETFDILRPPGPPVRFRNLNFLKENQPV